MDVFWAGVSSVGDVTPTYLGNCGASPAGVLFIHYLFKASVMEISSSLHLEEDRLVGHLAAMPDGAPAPVLCGLLGVSQPTLSRMLRRLQARGLILAEGNARSRRYHWIGGRPGLAALRRRRLHELVAHKLVEQPELLDRARRRLVSISESNAAGYRYHRQWLELMERPRHKLLRKMTEDSDEADLLRKESPFTVLIDAEEREELFRRLGQAA